MFFVVSKEKIMCYIIAFSMVVILLGLSVLGLPREELIQTFAQEVDNEVTQKSQE